MSCEQLEASLTQIGIKVPANLPKIVLRKFLIENMNTASPMCLKSLRMIMQILVLFSLNHHPFRHVIYQQRACSALILVYHQVTLYLMPTPCSTAVLLQAWAEVMT
jgi:hypothetical protein